MTTLANSINARHKLPTGAQVPSASIVFEGPESSTSCVIIPVINEGSRIKNLLIRMADAAISSMADILIVDGGSVDGSLEENMLRELGVKVLILKTGAGKLSAQLRCAYAYALQANYHNIVTIDGNDKDDPSTIPQFIEAMHKGYDFVQASRFVKGGIAENTPLIRDLAIRFIHAPALALASGFAWTDTTQGYRGYSRKMLSDPKVAIFREIFSGYELLAYLSYCAPRLGYRCVEIGTRRSYPKGEVPTKISQLRGNWDVLMVLLKACTGYYNPKL